MCENEAEKRGKERGQKVAETENLRMKGRGREGGGRRREGERERE